MRNNSIRDLNAEEQDELCEKVRQLELDKEDLDCQVDMIITAKKHIEAEAVELRKENNKYKE